MRSRLFLVPPRLEQRWARRLLFIVAALTGMMVAGHFASAAPDVPTATTDAAEPAPSTSSAPLRHFYFGVDYGPKPLPNPFWFFINRGYDVIQDHIASRDVVHLPYASNAANVGRNVVNPFPAISDDGWGKFLREEIFPLSYGNTTARWLPNYSLHRGFRSFRRGSNLFYAHRLHAPEDEHDAVARRQAFEQTIKLPQQIARLHVQRSGALAIQHVRLLEGEPGAHLLAM